MHLARYLWWFQVLLLTSYVACYRRDHSSQRVRNFLSTTCKADANEPWSYRGGNGPTHWGESYPTCNGNEQSPIAISSRNAGHDWKLSKLSMNNYDRPVTKATILNNGHTVQVTPIDGIERTIYVKDATYRLLQLHFHWGDSYHGGSEHTVDGIRYSMELHYVHQNANNQTAVVGVFFQEQSKKVPEMQTIINEFPSVLYRDMQGQLKSSLNLNNLLPANPSSFYRYDGSLTVPECNEGVTWSVLTKPLPIGKQQMAEFRKLFSSTKADASPKCTISNNFRPIQPLNQRKVYKSQ